MRVVYIADVGIEGGATKSLVELISNMKRLHGIEPIVLTSGYNKLNNLLEEEHIENYAVGHGAFLQGAPDSLWKKPIKYILYGILYYARKKSSLNKALSCVDWEKVDLIHTNVARDDLGMEISRIKKIPNICHIREFGELDFNCWSYKKNYVAYLKNNTDGFIAISNAVKDYWIKKGLLSDQIKVIYNGVDWSKIKCVNYSEWDKTDVLKLVIVGGVIPNKGQWQAIEALCGLPIGIRDKCTLDVIGGITESYKHKLMEPLRKHGIEEQVHFLGACDDIYERLKDYHVGLMCSKAEGFGRVTVEYMHAGLAVIASNCGANPELIKDGEVGLLYNYNQTFDLIRNIEFLFNNRKQMKEIALRGKNYAKKSFTCEENANRIVNYYDNVLDNRGER